MALVLKDPYEPREVHDQDRERFRGWYTRLNFSGSSVEILGEALEIAKKTISDTIPADELASFGLNDAHSLEDVQRSLNNCRASYESKKTSKVRKWVAVLSSKISFYSPVLDVLSQVKPEYGSLVWGTMKFLFMAIANHEEMIHQFSKACSNIADVLPRTELSLILYPTERMTVAVARLYSKIMEFMLHAIRWYRQGKVSHTWAAVTKPWSHSFKDHVDAIGNEARRVDDLSSLAMKAEMRETRIQILETREQLLFSQQQIRNLSEFVKGEFKQLLDVALSNRTIHSQVKLDVSSSAQMIGNIQLGQILSSSFLNRLPTSGESLAYCESLQKRSGRPPRANVGSAQIQQWAGGAQSSFLFPRCGFRLESREVLVQMIKMIRTSGKPLLWALRYQGCLEQEITAVDLIRMLVMQALQLNPSALQKGENPLSVTHLREAADEEGWLEILNRALVDVPEVYIVMDSELLNHAIIQNRYQATRLLELMSRNIQSRIKLIVPSTSIDLTYVNTHWTKETWTQLDFNSTNALETLRKKRRQAKRLRKRW